MNKITKISTFILAMFFGVANLAIPTSALAKESIDDANYLNLNGNDGVNGVANPSYKAYYDEAYASVKDYQYGYGAMRATIQAIDEQISGFADWQYIPYALYQIEGHTEVTSEHSWWQVSTTSNDGFLSSRLHSALYGEDNTSQAYDSFRNEIATAKADARYASDKDFKNLVDTCATVYNYGTTTLKKPSLSPIRNSIL